MPTELTKTQKSKIINCLKVPKGCEKKESRDFISKVCVFEDTVYVCNYYIIVKVTNVDTSAFDDVTNMTEEQKDLLEKLFEIPENDNDKTIFHRFNPALLIQILDVFKAFDYKPCIYHVFNRVYFRTNDNSINNNISAICMAMR